jgi:hypothetical protein
MAYRRTESHFAFKNRKYIGYAGKGSSAADNLTINHPTDFEGIWGEIPYAKYFGHELSDIRWDLPHGDGGYDFITPDGLTVDVTASTTPHNLLCYETKQHADIYVLVRIKNEWTPGRLVGWAYGQVLRQSKPKHFGKDDNRPDSYHDHRRSMELYGRKE